MVSLLTLNHHHQFSLKGGIVHFTDVKSTNGSKLNGCVVSIAARFTCAPPPSSSHVSQPNKPQRGPATQQGHSYSSRR